MSCDDKGTVVPMRNVFLLVLGCWLLLVADSGFCTEEKVIRLKEAVDVALRDNHLLRAERSAVEAGRQEIGLAASGMGPIVTIEERYLRTANPTYGFMAKLNQQRFTVADFRIDSLNHPNPANDFQTSLAVEKPLFARQVQIGEEMAGKEAEAMAWQFQRSREEIAMEVVKAYLAVRTGREFVVAASKGVEDAAEHVRIAEMRHDNGLGLYSDILRAKTAQTAAEQRLVSAGKNHDVARRGLGLLLGVNEPVGVGDEEIDLPVRDLVAWQEAAAGRHDILAMEARRQVARKGLDLAGAGFLPTIGVGGSYQFNDHENFFGGEGESWQLAAIARWQLYDGGRRQYEKAKARYRITESDEYLAGLKKRVDFAVYEAYRGVEESGKNLELAEAALATAEEGQRLVRVRYENSLSQLVDLLHAQAALDQARAMAVAGRNDHLVARALLSCQGGMILRDLGVAEEINEANNGR